MDPYEQMLANGATPEEIAAMRRTMLPLTRQLNSVGGAITNDVQPGQSGRMLPLTLGDKADYFTRRGLNLYAAEPDVTGLQQYARQRSEEGNRDMLRALAAQLAGERFAPVQAQFLKRAMAAQEPLKVGNAGYITPSGEYVKDPTYALDRRAEKYLGLGAQYMRADEQEKARIANEQVRRELAQDSANLRRDLARDSADLRREGIAAQRAQQAIMNEIRLMNAETQRMMVEGRYGNQTPAEQVSMAGSNVTPKIITPEVQPAEAVGFKGVWQSGVNKIADAFGAGNPQDPNKIATDRLEALGNQTQLYLQDAVPGRPSNYLLQMFEKQAVRPNQFFMGEAGAQTRAQSTIAVIDIGLSDLARIINNPTGYSKDDIAKARDGYNRLSQLKAEYNAFLGSFGDQSPAGDEVDALVQQYLAPQ